MARIRVSDVDADGVARPRSLGGATLATRVRYGNSPDSDLAPDNLRALVENAAQGLVLVSLRRDHLLPAATYWYEVDLRQETLTKLLRVGVLRSRPL